MELLEHMNVVGEHLAKLANAKRATYSAMIQTLRDALPLAAPALRTHCSQTCDRFERQLVLNPAMRFSAGPDRSKFMRKITETLLRRLAVSSIEIPHINLLGIVYDETGDSYDDPIAGIRDHLIAYDRTKAETYHELLTALRAIYPEAYLDPYPVGLTRTHLRPTDLTMTVRPDWICSNAKGSFSELIKQLARAIPNSSTVIDLLNFGYRAIERRVCEDIKTAYGVEAIMRGAYAQMQ